MSKKKDIKLGLLTQVAYYLRRDFRKAMPWMYMFFLHREFNRFYMYHYLASLPTFSLAVLGTDTLVFNLNWNGEQTEDFLFANVKEKDNAQIEEVIGKKGQKAKWSEAIDKHKPTFIPSVILGIDPYKNENDQYADTGDQLKNYKASSKIVLRKIRTIDVYTWGFEILTRTPLAVVAIKSRHLKASLGHNSRHEVDKYLNSITGQKFELPHSHIDVKDIKYFWSHDGIGSITNEEMEVFLSQDYETDSSDSGNKTKHIIDGGQRSANNIIF